MGTYVKVSVFLLMLVFLTGDIGSFTPELNKYIALGLLAAFALMYFPIVVPRNKTRQNILAFSVFALSAIAFLQGGIYSLMAMVFFLFAMDIILKTGDRKEPELYPLLLTTSVYSLFFIFYLYVPQVWFAYQSMSSLLSIVMGTLIRQDISWGATYFGLRTITIFLIFYLSIFLLSGFKKFYLFVISLVSIIVSVILYGFFHFYLILGSVSIPGDISMKFSGSQILLYLFCLPYTYFFLRKFTSNDGLTHFNRKNLLYLTSSAILLFLSVGFLTFSFPLTHHTGSILFYDKGYLDWKTPSYSQFGGESGGMFGLLPEYLRTMGYRVERGSITVQSLQNTSTLVIINLNQPLSEERELILDFIRNGGSLLLMGDHTGIQQIREPSNDLLGPVKISLNFDSAIALRERWDHDFEFRSHPINNRIRRDADTQIGIGASLTISPPARPVIIGRHGFSDKGNFQAPEKGYLGDMKYSQDEYLGDLVLVAENYYGKGKVLVFGDTSSFQNGALAQSYQFINQIFQWLNIPKKAGYPYNICLSLILLLPALIILFIQRGGMTAITICSAALYFSLFITTTIIPGLNTGKNAEAPNAMLAYIDASHLERFSYEPWIPKGIGGLTYNLMRNNYLPFMLEKFSEKKVINSRIFTVIAPAKPFSSNEIKALEEFMKRGGFMILTVGWEEAGTASNLLQNFHLEVENTPLGSVEPSQNDHGLMFHKAWPVGCSEGEAEILCHVWDHPVIILKPYYQGGILLIGDSYFLLNENLEGAYNFSLPNIMFLKMIVERFQTLSNGSVK